MDQKLGDSISRGSSLEELLREFADARTLEELWANARKLMQHKQRATAVGNPLLVQGLRKIGEVSKTGDGIERLVALDLLVRLPASIRKLQAPARDFILQAIERPLPPLSSVSDKKQLPQGAEPAEVRENVAVALDEATGTWVLPYLFRALAEEDRSQRCRIAIVRAIAKREPVLDKWIKSLVEQEGLRTIAFNREVGPTRVRDLCFAISEIATRYKAQLKVTAQLGQSLTQFVRTTLPLRLQDPLPPRLDEAAAAIVRLMDDALAIRLTLMDDSDYYQPLELIRQWWSPLPFPPALNSAVESLVEKIMAGIVFRARGGHRAEDLARRLRQALNDDKLAKQKLLEIAESEPGLPKDVQDWMLGNERSSTTTISYDLGAVATEDFIRALAPIFRTAVELSEGSNSTERRPERIENAIVSLGKQYGLEIFGSQGDIVEFSPLRFELVSESQMPSKTVKIVRPTVVRRRVDGTVDVVTKGLVVAA